MADVTVAPSSAPSPARAHHDHACRADGVGASLRPYVDLLTGRTPSFTCQADQRFSYCLHLPHAIDTSRSHPLVVSIHGTERAPESYRDGFASLADKHQCVILAPLFPAGIGDPDDVDNYKTLDYRGIRFDLLLLVASSRTDSGICTRIDRRESASAHPAASPCSTRPFRGPRESPTSPSGSADRPRHRAGIRNRARRGTRTRRDLPRRQPLLR